VTVEHPSSTASKIWPNELLIAPEWRLASNGDRSRPTEKRKAKNLCQSGPGIALNLLRVRDLYQDSRDT
jgi:hypothetical protein